MVRLGVVFACVGLLGCDADLDPHFPEGDGVTLGGASAVAVVCDEFCGASFAVGCPPDPDGCLNSCQSLFHGTCERKLADYLDCIPERLVGTCQVTVPREDDPCNEVRVQIETCLFCGTGEASLVGVRGCRGTFTCGLVTTCDDDGACSCYEGDEVIGTCTAPVGGLDACVSVLSCCGAFL